ncbi:MAG: hypothetical protein QM811_32035 [Pirellulales bacterium]
MIPKFLRFLVLLPTLFVLISPLAASMVVELIALPGSGYTVTPDGKTVTFTSSSPTSVNLQLVAGNPSGTLFVNQVQGTLLTSGGVNGGYLTGGSIGAPTYAAPYVGLSSTGLSQNLPVHRRWSFPATAWRIAGRSAGLR